MLNNSSAIRFERSLSYFLVFAFTSGTLAHCLPAVLPITKLTTDGLLFVINGLVLYAIYRTRQDKRLFTWLIIAYAFTFAMEAIGVATGAIFGEYHYGPTMWLQWLGVPFVIAFNWCVLTLACNEIACWVLSRHESDTFNEVPPSTSANQQSTINHQASRAKNQPLTILLTASAAILTALYDVTIEPVAIALDYWQWHAGEIPLQNYLAWAAIAFLISLPLYLFNIRFRSPALRVYFFAQLFFFAVLNFML